jgi:hypothetical protein
VIDGCGINGRYWVFATLLSDFAQTLEVTDTVPTVTKSYSNPLGNTPTTVIDRQAFVSSTTSTIFADSFESGNTDAWSVAVPAP